ncbi:PaaI family thioesterase [Geopsychrobacter electrodiphilus]|uniref:PaaI family thioesterase n=1 Tax=Geopsychrobacter electrodiphilus TaxID=225196 RepID=UPI0003660C93|nr:PaaI family thioesterase [Geopsychrobacter electrodiphilus]
MKIEGKIAFEVVEQTPEQVISEMPILAGVLNPYGVVNAGAILWFADITATLLVMGPSSRPTEGMAGFPLAITLNANFVSNQKEGTFKAVATYVKKGKKVNVVRTIIYGKKDRLIADVTTNHVPAK